MLCLSYFVYKLINREGSPGWEMAVNPLTAEPVLARFDNKPSALLPAEQRSRGQRDRGAHPAGPQVRWHELSPRFPARRGTRPPASRLCRRSTAAFCSADAEGHSGKGPGFALAALCVV